MGNRVILFSHIIKCWSQQIVPDGISINGPDDIIIGLGSKELTWNELLNYVIEQEKCCNKKKSKKSAVKNF